MFAFLKVREGGGGGIEKEQSFQDEDSLARRAGGTSSRSRSAVEERHCRIHHRRRVLRRAPVYKASPAEGARGQRQYQSNIQGRLAWMWRRPRLNGDPTIICQRPGTSSDRSTAPEGALVREVPSAEDPAESATKERQCTMYHRSKEREESATRASAKERARSGGRTE